MCDILLCHDFNECWASLQLPTMDNLSSLLQLWIKQETSDEKYHTKMLTLVMTGNCEMRQRIIYNSILFSARSIYPKKSRTVGYHNSLHLRLQSFIERCLYLSTVIGCRAPNRCSTRNTQYIKSTRQRSLSKCVFIYI